jgi:hypothetical protein
MGEGTTQGHEIYYDFARTHVLDAQSDECDTWGMILDR